MCVLAGEQVEGKRGGSAAVRGRCKGRVDGGLTEPALAGTEPALAGTEQAPHRAGTAGASGLSKLGFSKS